MSSRLPLFRSVPTLVLVGVACALVWWIASVHSLDFNVYRTGARAYLGLEGDTALYDAELWHVSGDSWLPFTYPPFAVLFFLPYALIPAGIGAVLHTGLLIVSMLVVVHLIITRTPRLNEFLRRQSRWRHAVLAGLLVFLVGFSGPWRESMSFGQINAVLMAVVLLDILGTRRAVLPRGLLTGLVAGVKLTPLAMGLFFLAQRDWKAILWMGIGFFGSIAAGFFITAKGSVYFWTEALFTTSRVGNDADMYTVTLKAFSQRLGLSDQGASFAWIGLSLVTIVLGYLATRRLLASGEVVAAVGVVATVMLMISPISWFHHWVWFILLLPALALPAHAIQRPARLWKQVGAAGLYLLFLASSFTMSILYYGTIQGQGPWWMELLSSIWMFVAIAAITTITTTIRTSSDGSDPSHLLHCRWTRPPNFVTTLFARPPRGVEPSSDGRLDRTKPDRR